MTRLAAVGLIGGSSAALWCGILWLLGVFS